MLVKTKIIKSWTSLCGFIGLGSRIRDGEVVGPITVPGNDFIPSGIPLYTGKIKLNQGLRL